VNAPSSIALAVKHLNEPLPDLASLAPGTPPSLVAPAESSCASGVQPTSLSVASQARTWPCS